MRNAMLMLATPGAGFRLKKAEELGVRVINEADWASDCGGGVEMGEETCVAYVAVMAAAIKLEVAHPPRFDAAAARKRGRTCRSDRLCVGERRIRDCKQRRNAELRSARAARPPDEVGDIVVQRDERRQMRVDHVAALIIAILDIAP